MDRKKTLQKRITALQQSGDSTSAIEQKLDEFLLLLTTSEIDSEKIKDLESRIQIAFKQTTLNKTQLKAFEALDDQPDLSRTELLDNLDFLLSQHQLDSNLTKNYLKRDWVKRIVLIMTGVIMITLGYSMIILPAPPYFEMFTVFYFTDQDGVTIMDLISLLIILTGVYFIIVNLIKKVTN